jgi:DNA polymerase III alpha subunit (gram-positive type)
VKEFIILEIIPTHSKKELGKIIQLQALKIKDMNLIDRFDYRLNEDKISNKDLVNLISYDKDYFKYVNDDKKILKEFSKWSKKLPLLILDNSYTNDYLSGLKNKKESICNYLDTEYSDDLIGELIKKYKLEPSNHIVDLLYESMIMHDNEKKS